ncbi:MAG: hypothetical protein V3V01_18220 [Acidimicrobiales bacterium]
MNDSSHGIAVDTDMANATIGAGQRSLRSLLPIILPLLFVPAVVGYVASSLQTERYLAQAEVTHQIVNPSFGVTDRLLATQEIKARSRALAVTVAADFGLTVETVVGDLEIEGILTGINEESTALRIGFRHENPDTALLVVQAYVEAYLASVVIDERVPGLEDAGGEIAELQIRRNVLVEQIALANSAGDSDFASELNEEFDRVREDLGIQVAIFNSLRPNTPVVVAEQLGSSWLQGQPVEPTPLRIASLGLVVGICLSAMVLLIFRRPRTQQSRTQQSRTQQSRTQQ